MDEIASIAKHKTTTVFTIQDKTQKDNIKPTIIIPALITITFCGVLGLILLSGMVSGLSILIPVFGIMELAGLAILMPWLMVSIWRRNKTYSGPRKTVTLDDERRCIAISDYPPNDLLDTEIPYIQVNQIANHFEMVGTGGIFYVLVLEIASSETSARTLLYQGIPSTQARELVDTIIDRCKSVGGRPELIDEGSISDAGKVALQERKESLLGFMRSEFSAEHRIQSKEIAKGAFLVSDTESNLKIMLVQRIWSNLFCEIVSLVLMAVLIIPLVSADEIWRFISTFMMGILGGFLVFFWWLERGFTTRSCNRYVHLNKASSLLTINEKSLFHTSIEQHHVAPGSYVFIESAHGAAVGAAVCLNIPPNQIFLFFSPREESASMVAAVIRKAIAGIRK